MEPRMEPRTGPSMVPRMEPRRVAAVQFLTPRTEPRGSENLVRGGRFAVQNLDRIAVQKLDRVFGPAI